jgi:capsular exopolysaccharide synthesis family protein
VDVNRVLAVSRPYIEKMIFKLQLRDEEGNSIKADDLTKPGIISRKPSVGISQYQEADILQIGARSPDPEEAKMMANTLGEIMVDQNQIQMRAEYKSARGFLEDQMGKVKERYRAALLRLTSFMKQEKTLDMNAEMRLAVEKMAELLEQKEDNIIDLAEARATMNRLKEQLAKHSPEFVSASALRESSQIDILKRGLTQLKLDLTKATAELTGQHPEVLSLKKQIRMAEAELKREIEVYRSSAPELTRLQRQLAALEVHLEGVNADIDKYSKALSGLPDKASEHASINMELSVSREAYSSLLDSLYQIGIAEATALSVIRVVEPAIKAVVPVSPNKPLNSVLGLFVGLVIGVGLAFILEYLDETIRTAEDMREFEPIPLIGAVPKQEEMHLIWSVDPNDPLYEAYRKIRTHINIMDHMAETPLQNLLVLSAVPGEGKSTTVSNLAISACRKGKRVAVIDADLRRPVLHTYFGVPNDVGLADVVQGKASADEAIRPTPIEGLSVIVSGSALPDPGELIESDRMRLFISELRDRFDFVIMDSPPLLVKADALILSEYVDGSIIVLESGRTTRHEVHELIEMLAKANIKPLGFILNRFSVERGKHYYHQYYYYSRYRRKLFAGEGS